MNFCAASSNTFPGHEEGAAKHLGRLPPLLSFFSVSFSTGQPRSFRSASSTACARKKKKKNPSTFSNNSKFSNIFLPRDGLEGKFRKDQTQSQCLAVKKILSFSALKHSPGKSKRENHKNNDHLVPRTFTPNDQNLELT